MQAEPANPMVQLGLPPTWQPTPLLSHAANVTLRDNLGGEQTIDLLIIDGPTGRQAFAYTRDEFRALGELIMQQCAGLTIARDLPTN